MITRDQIKQKLTKTEPALVNEGWFKSAAVLVSAMLYYIFLGQIMDAGWIWVHGSTIAQYMTADNMADIDSIYNIFFYLIYLVGLFVIFHIINATNRNQEMM